MSTFSTYQALNKSTKVANSRVAQFSESWAVCRYERWVRGPVNKARVAWVWYQSGRLSWQVSWSSSLLVPTSWLRIHGLFLDSVNSRYIENLYNDGATKPIDDDVSTYEIQLPSWYDEAKFKRYINSSNKNIEWKLKQFHRQPTVANSSTKTTGRESWRLPCAA